MDYIVGDTDCSYQEVCEVWMSANLVDDDDDDEGNFIQFVGLLGLPSDQVERVEERLRTKEITFHDVLHDALVAFRKLHEDDATLTLLLEAVYESGMKSVSRTIVTHFEAKEIKWFACPPVGLEEFEKSDTLRVLVLWSPNKIITRGRLKEQDYWDNDQRWFVSYLQKPQKHHFFMECDDDDSDCLLTLLLETRNAVSKGIVVTKNFERAEQLCRNFKHATLTRDTYRWSTLTPECQERQLDKTLRLDDGDLRTLRSVVNEADVWPILDECLDEESLIRLLLYEKQNRCTTWVEGVGNNIIVYNPYRILPTTPVITRVGCQGIRVKKREIKCFVRPPTGVEEFKKMDDVDFLIILSSNKMATLAKLKDHDPDIWTENNTDAFVMRMRNGPRQTLLYYGDKHIELKWFYGSYTPAFTSKAIILTEDFDYTRDFRNIGSVVVKDTFSWSDFTEPFQRHLLDKMVVRVGAVGHETLRSVIEEENAWPIKDEYLDEDTVLHILLHEKPILEFGWKPPIHTGKIQDMELVGQLVNHFFEGPDRIKFTNECPNVVMLYGNNTDTSSQYLALEKNIKELRREKIFTSKASHPKKVLEEASKGLDNLHSLGILHKCETWSNMVIAPSNGRFNPSAVISEHLSKKKSPSSAPPNTEDSQAALSRVYENLVLEDMTPWSAYTFSLGDVDYYVLTLGLLGREPPRGKDNKVIDFLLKVTERLTSETAESSLLMQKIEVGAEDVVRGDWLPYACDHVQKYMRRSHSLGYDGKSVLSLLKAISDHARNSRCALRHFETCVHYFIKRFPLLVPHVRAASKACRLEIQRQVLSAARVLRLEQQQQQGEPVTRTSTSIRPPRNLWHNRVGSFLTRSLRSLKAYRFRVGSSLHRRPCDRCASCPCRSGGKRK